MENKRIDMKMELPEVPAGVAAELKAKSVTFLLPEELALVGGGATFQFAYDFPEGYA